MLARICMTLQPQEICSALSSDPKTKIRFVKERNLGLKYEPSYNIAPGDIAPIIISSQHFDSDEFFYSVHPALWGLIPRWHKGTYNDHGFNTTNFRSEKMNESRMYKPTFSRGRRCVLVCEGYYENLRVPYNLSPKDRLIFYIFSKQQRSIEIHDKSTWNWKKINLLFIAGVFDVWANENNEEIINFTILSMKSEDNVLSWLHPRTPVILESAYQIYQWLNFNEFDEIKALKLIKHPKSIEWYEVSDYVLNVRNKDSECNKPLRVFKYQRQYEKQEEGDEDSDNKD